MRSKNWDQHVVDAEVVARRPGFVSLRDRIIELAQPAQGHRVVDVGSGTGLLALPLAEQVAHVWAIDTSAGMTDYLRTKASSAGLDNIEAVVASAVSLPLVDESVDVVVSNYCLHHLDDAGKHLALLEAWRVLHPGGRLVIGDMMFGLGMVRARDREVIAQKVVALLRMGAPGVVRLFKNGLRVAGHRWENPARGDWWSRELEAVGFVDVGVELLEHEGGLAWARKPGERIGQNGTTFVRMPL